MAILNHDDLLTLINSRVSADNTDEDITFLENMTDTITALESNSGADEIARLQAENASLRQKYRDRFMSGSVDPLPDPEPEPPKELTYNDLFKED